MKKLIPILFAAAIAFGQTTPATPAPSSPIPVL